MQSRCHRTIIRWLHDGIARASRSRVAFLRQSGSFLFPSYCLREAKNARWHRWSHEDDTIWQDALTMDLRRAKWTHEFNTKMNLRKIFRQLNGAWETPPAVIRWLKMSSRKARCCYDLSWIWTSPLSCVHLGSISGQCDAEYIIKIIPPEK